MSEFLLELKIEEIPAGLQKGGEEALKKLISKLLSDNGIEGFDLQSESMSSRITIWSKNIPSESKEIFEEKIGPKVKVGLDDNNEPTRALQGYMRSNGLESIDQLEQKETSKGLCFTYTKHIESKKTADVLSENLETIIRNVPFPKSMRWGDGDIHFVRPIFNVLCIVDGETVPFTLGDLQSNNQSYGHFFLHPEAFDVKSVEGYFKDLNDRKVMLKRKEREDVISAQLEQSAKSINVKLVDNPRLISEVSGLVEWPFPVISAIDDRYLELPKEILITTMVTHQKYFALEDEDGHLSKYFIGISNMPDANDNISHGYRKVLTARFDDAVFYWEQDRKLRLDSLRDKLKSIIFQKDLGTVYDKMNRVEQQIYHLETYIDDLDVTTARRIAQIAKCDLSCGVVYEFPELQGIMGSYYAEYDGEADIVVNALKKQYEYEDFSGLEKEALAFILADRLDTLVGFFGINQKPTGSKDPYALRRAALSVIRLLKSGNIRLDLNAFLGNAFDSYDGILKQDKKTTIDGVKKFLITRLQIILKGQVSHDIIEAIISKDLNDLVDIMNRIHVLNEFMQELGGKELHGSFKRANNILAKIKDIGGEDVIKAMLPAEIDLYSTSKEISARIQSHISTESYLDAMKELLRLSTPMNTFFDDIKVMDDDNEVKESRLALLKYIVNLFDQFANMRVIES